jgi:hypothetical protein
MGRFQESKSSNRGQFYKSEKVVDCYEYAA